MKRRESNGPSEVCGIPSDVPGVWASQVGKAKRDLLQINVTPDDVRDKARKYRVVFDGCALTCRALVNHWFTVEERWQVEEQQGSGGCAEMAALAIRLHELDLLPVEAIS